MDESIKQTMDYKGKQIKKFVDAKEKSMALFAAGRDATMIVSELYNNLGDLDGAEEGEFSKEKIIQRAIKEWRNWFYYEIYSTDPDEEAIEEAKKNMNPTEFLGF